MRSGRRSGRIRRTIGLWAFLALTILGALVEAGTLGQIRQDVRDGSSSGRSKASEKNRDSDDDDGDSWLAGLLFGILTSGNDDEVEKEDHCYRMHDDGSYVISSMYADGSSHHHDEERNWVTPLEPPIVLNEPFPTPDHAAGDTCYQVAGFPQFPYQSGPGYMLLGSHELESATGEFGSLVRPGPLPQTHAQRLRFEYADEFDDVARTSGHVLLTAFRLGLDAEIDYLREDLPAGGFDSLWLGDCNMVYRFAQSEHALWRTGLGFNWLDDPIETNFGFNFTCGADFFPAKPLIVSSTIDLGKLGDATLFRYRLTSGVIINRYEVYVGYEYLDIGSSEIGSLTSGVRIWF